MPIVRCRAASLTVFLLFTGFAVDPCHAQSSGSFDVAYVSEFRTGVFVSGFNAGTMGVLINTGTQPLDLAQLRIVSISDDHPDAQLTFEIFRFEVPLLEPGQAAGGLSQVAEQLIVGSGLVLEPLMAASFDLSLGAVNLPVEQEEVVNGSIVLALGAQEVTLPVTIRTAPSVPTDLDLLTATRVASVLQSPAATLDSLILLVAQLAEAGRVRPSDARNLQQRLEDVKERLERGRTRAAIQKLRSFIKKVNDRERSGRILGEDADALLAGADAILQSLK
jgi:hypothetical protein